MRVRNILLPQWKKSVQFGKPIRMVEGYHTEPRNFIHLKTIVVFFGLTSRWD